MLIPTVQRDDGWLLYAARVPEPCPGDAATLLAWSGELPGGCKFARGAASAELVVRAELPLSAECSDRDAWVRAGFAAAAKRLGLPAAPAEPGAAPAGVPPADLAGLCREAAWPFDERSDGSLAVDLGVPGAYLAARLAARAERIALEAELVRLPGAEAACRAALLMLMLRANGAFRMVRAVLREPGPGALLEVCLPGVAGAGELGEALAALAVAAQHSALEARALAIDEPLARAYLERSGIFPPVRGN